MAQKGKITVTNMVYGLGAAIVIVGALFKIQHWPYGSLILTIGMIVEALVFTYSAFERQAADLDWSLVYPELAGGQSSGKKKKEEPKDAEGLLSKKLDNLLKEAKIDGELMASLGSSIKNFEGAAKNISPTVDSLQAQKKYSEELSLAAAQSRIKIPKNANPTVQFHSLLATEKAVPSDRAVFEVSGGSPTGSIAATA